MNLLVFFLAIVASNVHALKGRARLSKNFANSRSLLKVDLRDLPSSNKPVIIEIISKTESSALKKDKSDVSIVSAYSVYKEQKEDRMVETLTDSPLLKIIGVVLNPTSLLLIMYLSSIGWSQVLWLQKIFKIFGRGTLSKKEGEKGYVTPVEDLPFQTFECEKCKMEMRPARGRAEAIFARERFRCSRCGSKASAYFNVDDLSDPRAVARLERIKKEQEEEAGAVNDDGDEEGEEEEEEEEEEETPPPRKGGKRKF